MKHSMLMVVLCSGCAISVTEGLYACTSDEDCPRNWVCADDGRCYRMMRSDAGTEDATTDTTLDSSSDAPPIDAPGVDAPGEDAPALDAPGVDAPVDGCTPTTETCNTRDDDCDGMVDEDEDGDGFGVCDDCDDDDPNRNPNEPEICGDGADNDCDPGTADACCRSGWTLIDGLCRSPQRGPVSTCRQAINDCLGDDACPASPDEATGFSGDAYVVTNIRRCRRHGFVGGVNNNGSDVGADESVGSFPYWCVARPLQQTRNPCVEHRDCPDSFECNSGTCRFVALAGTRCCAGTECSGFVCSNHLVGDIDWVGRRSAVAPGFCD